MSSKKEQQTITVHDHSPFTAHRTTVCPVTSSFFIVLSTSIVTRRPLRLIHSRLPMTTSYTTSSTHSNRW